LEYPPIGSGAFGVVHRATWRGALVAVKQVLIHPARFIETNTSYPQLLVVLNDKQLQEFMHEAQIMAYVLL
jgi:serine/threonine protein kinase